MADEEEGRKTIDLYFTPADVRERAQLQEEARSMTELLDPEKVRSSIEVLNPREMKKELDTKRAGCREIAAGLLIFREDLLAYDPTEDHDGRIWDWKRIELDRTLQEAIAAAQHLGE